MCFAGLAAACSAETDSETTARNTGQDTTASVQYHDIGDSTTDLGEWDASTTRAASENLWADIEGDELVVGPSRDLPEAFFTESAALDTTSGILQSVSATTPEEFIRNVLESLWCASAALAPTREWLFKLIRSAVTEALESEFDRLALVGSVALDIDLPTSDIDIVAFTKVGLNTTRNLHQIASVVTCKEPCLHVQIIARARVPLLVVSTPDGGVSMDLSLDQALPEKHVNWFMRRTRTEPVDLPELPRQLSSQHDQSLQTALLRFVKLWLRQRHLPATREGGPPAFAWMLMAIHSLQCSPAVEDSENNRHDRNVLSAIATFFGEFSIEGRRSGAILFCDSGESTFQFQPFEGHPLWPKLSVLDPVLCSQNAPPAQANLVPTLSMATQLLYAYELQRASQLSAEALRLSASSDGAGAIKALFAERPESGNFLPSVLANCTDWFAELALVLQESCLHLVMLCNASPRSGWTAPFLHRLDNNSTLQARICDVNLETGAVSVRLGQACQLVFTPAHFVSRAYLTAAGSLDPEDLQRLRDMLELLSRTCGQAQAVPEATEPLQCNGGYTDWQPHRIFPMHRSKNLGMWQPWGG